jgi:hypothetical protein
MLPNVKIKKAVTRYNHKHLRYKGFAADKVATNTTYKERHSGAELHSKWL